MSDDLAGIRATLEDGLARLREQQAQNISTDSLPSTAGGESTEPEPDCDSVSESAYSESVITPSTSDFPSPTSPGISVRKLRERFEAARMRGAMEGPAGEAVEAQRRKLAVRQAAAVSRQLVRVPNQNIQALVNNLASAEGAASGLWTKETADAAFSLAKAYQELGDYDSALQYYHEAFTAREAVLGPTHLKTLNTANDIGGVLELQSLWDDALAYYLQSLEGRKDEPTIGPNHPSYVATETRIARVRRQAGNVDGALQDFEAILATHRRRPSGASSESLSIRKEIADIQLERGNYSEATCQYQQILSEYELQATNRAVNLGPNHRLTLESKDMVKSIQEALEEAEKSRANDNGTAVDPPPLRGSEDNEAGPSSTTTTQPAQPAPSPSPDEDDNVAQEISEYATKLEKARREYGSEAPETLLLIAQLGDAYARNNQHQTAIGWFREALRGEERTFGTTNRMTLDTVHMMGESFSELRDLPSALDYLSRAQRGRETILGAGHPDTLDTVLELGKAHARVPDYTQARQLTFRAIDGYSAKYGLVHASTLRARSQLAEIFGLQGKHEESRVVYQEVLARRMASLGPDHPSTLMTKHALAVAHRESGDEDGAIPLLAEAIPGRERLLGRYHSLTVSSVLQLASAYWNTKQPRNAVEYYLWAYEGLTRNGSKCIPTMCNIAYCYKVLKEGENALCWYQKVLNHHETSDGPDHENTIRAVDDIAHVLCDLEKWEEAATALKRVIASKDKTLPTDDEDLYYRLFRLAHATFEAGQLDEALIWSRRFVGFPISVEAELLLRTKRRVALILARQKKFDESAEMYHETVEQSRNHLGEDHWLVSACISESAGVYSAIRAQIRNSQDLESQRERVMRLMDRDTLEGLRMLVDLADVHLDQHKYHEARAMYEEAFEILQNFEIACFETDAFDAAKHLVLKLNLVSAMASAHLALSDHDAALQSHRMVLEIIHVGLVAGREDEGDLSKLRISTLSQIANVHAEAGNFVASLNAYKDCLAVEEEAYGPDEMRVLKTVREIGRLQLRLGDSREALRSAQRALDGFKRIARDENPPTTSASNTTPPTDSGDSDEGRGSAAVQALRTLDFIGFVYRSLGRIDEALRTQQEVAESFERDLGPLEGPTLEAALRLATMLDGLERREKAQLWFNRALTGYRARVAAAGRHDDEVAVHGNSMEEQISDLREQIERTE